MDFVTILLSMAFFAGIVIPTVNTFDKWKKEMERAQEQEEETE